MVKLTLVAAILLAVWLESPAGHALAALRFSQGSKVDTVGWFGMTTLNLIQGNAVYSAAHAVVATPMEHMNDGSVLIRQMQASMNDLAVADRVLANSGITVPFAGNRTAARVNEMRAAAYEINAAQTEFGKGHYDTAIEDCRNAWQCVLNAVRP